MYMKKQIKLTQRCYENKHAITERVKTRITMRRAHVQLKPTQSFHYFI